MRYIIKYTESNPDGGTCGVSYYLCETERDMERMCNAFANGHPYETVTCLGPIMPVPQWMREVIEKYT